MRAFEAGLLTAGAAEGLLRLSSAEQIAAVELQQAQLRKREHRTRTAAKIIGNYLDSHQDHIDLAHLRELLIDNT